MVWKNGTNRLVQIIPQLNIVIKIAKFHPLNFFSDAKLFLSAGMFWEALCDSIDTDGLKHWLFKGLHENWNEFLYYRKKKYPFLAKTYFSLFGFINIQKFSPTLPESIEIWYIFNRAGLKDEIDALWKDGHHFSNDENFSWAKEKLIVRDYGGNAVRSAIDAIIEISKFSGDDNLFLKSEKRILESLKSGIPEKWKDS